MIIHKYQNKCKAYARYQQRGFTLLEILIALTIFAIISLILSQTLHNILNNQARVEQHNQSFEKIQFTLLLLSRDLEQTIDRPITNSVGAAENAFVGKDQEITFTHAGLFNPNNQQRQSTLQRTRYRFANGNLIRETWPTLDQATHSKPTQRILLTDISDLRFSFFNQQTVFSKQWPPDDKQKTLLPRAVQVSLTHKQWGNIVQLYLIPVQPITQNNEKPNEKADD